MKLSNRNSACSWGAEKASQRKEHLDWNQKEVRELAELKRWTFAEQEAGLESSIEGGRGERKWKIYVSELLSIEHV